MALKHIQAGIVPPVSSARARRIPDEEWDTYREILTKLYIDEETSKKDIIDIMANKHNFVITEKQLKHRFGKWGVRKHISSSDMGAILSLKRKQDAVAKDTKIQYQGHVLDKERLERASKRRKDHTTTPPLIPSHITLCRSQPRSPTPTQLATFAGYSNANNTIIAPDTNRENPYSSRFTNAASPTLHTLLEMPLNFEFADGQVLSPSPDMHWLNSFDLTLNPETTDTALAGSASENMLLDGGTVGLEPTTDPADRSVILGPSGEPTSIFQPSRFSPLLEVSSCSTNQLVLCSTSPDLFDISGRRTLATSTMSNNELPGAARNRYSISETPIGASSIPARYSIKGADSESIIPALQLIRSQLLTCMDDKNWCCHLAGSRRSTSQLAQEVTNDWLRFALDDLLCWCYDTSARFIRQRKVRTGDRRSGYQDSLPERYCDDGRISEPDAENARMSRASPNLHGRLTSSMKVHGCRTKGMFQVQLQEASRKVTENNGHQPSYFVTISFIPEVNDFTTGISVAFARFSGLDQQPRLCPTITAFNVVPYESEIITCIKQNNLKGVQRLLDKRQASTLDVDPRGNSLLYYAMFSGFSEIFRLLLQGGASTSCCTLFGYRSTLIDTIWAEFIEFSSNGSRYEEFSMNNIADINQCGFMTNLALTHGSEVSDHYAGNPGTPTPLFVLSISEWTENSVLSFPTLVEHLLTAGYSLDDRNYRGQTPLLYAAQPCQHRSLYFMKQFISRGANIHATDDNGRGALHLSLNFRKGLRESYVEGIMKEGLSQKSQEMAWWTSEDEYDSDAPVGDPDDVSVADDVSIPDSRFVRHKVIMDRSNTKNTYILWGYDYHIEKFQTDFSPGEDFKVFDPLRKGDNDPHSYVGDYDIDDFNRGSETEDWEASLPRSKQRIRVKHKILTLLEAGCDPNALDNKGASPSDYARREDLWPQWEWALEQSGYIYDEDTQLWIRNFSFSEIVDITGGG